MDKEDGALAAIASLKPTKGAPAGPVTVTGWQDKRCLGAHVLRAGGAGATFGLKEAGPVKLTWRLGGGKVQTREVFVEDKPVRVILNSK